MIKTEGPYYDPETEAVWGIEEGVSYSIPMEATGLVAFDLPRKVRSDERR